MTRDSITDPLCLSLLNGSNEMNMGGLVGFVPAQSGAFDNMSSQMTGLLNGSQQMNMGGLVGSIPAQSGALNQHLFLRQVSWALMGTFETLGLPIIIC